jgi:hypothetical protein
VRGWGGVERKVELGAILTVGQNGFDWIEPASALAGALVGGLVSYLTTRFFEKQRLREVYRGWAYAVIFKLVRLSNDLEQTHQHFTSCLGDLANIKDNDAIWQRLLDFAGFSDVEIVFSAEELAIVANMKDQQLTMDLMELEAGHRIVTSTLREITTLRQKIADSGLAKEIRGNVVTFVATPEQQAAIGPTLINLDSFAKSLVKNVPELTKLAKTVSTDLGRRIKAHYKFKEFVELNYPSSKLDTSQ